MKEAKEQNGLYIEQHECPGDTLESWLNALNKDDTQGVIMLIDEYDSPVTEFLPESPDKAQEICDLIRPFYRMIKKRDSLFYKVFITGVSKFSTTSMFTDANQFWPLMEKSADYANLYGFTKQEILDTYGEDIEDLFNEPLEDTIGRMSVMYNGYRFHPDQDVLCYNPVSIIAALHSRTLGPHWIRTAPSSTIIDVVGLHGMEVIHGVNITKCELFDAVSTAHYLDNWKQVLLLLLLFLLVVLITYTHI